MSEKKRRDITLGEMQDECSFRGHNCETIGGEPCKHYAICNQIRTKSCTPPEDWNLIDPPRFNEAQMAFWRGLHAIGIKRIKGGVALGDVYLYCESKTDTVGLIYSSKAEVTITLQNGETRDLAELLGKDGAET